MSLFGMMWVGVSGMSAQATKLSTVGDNIANANTTGYKKADTQFSTLVTPDSGVEYVAGGVQPQVRHNITEQGALTFTDNATDLAVSGAGFFLVEDSTGGISMTRAGSFRANGDGELVNAAGMKLLGYAGDGDAGVINGVAGLEPINMSSLSMQAAASQSGMFAVNFPADADATPAADLPSANAVTAAPAAQTSMVVYDNLGREVILDVYASKIGPEEWEVSVFDQGDAGATGFPYAAGPLVTQTFQFDPANGQLTAGSAVSVAVPVPGGQLLTLDMSKSSQLAADYSVFDINIDGNGAAAMSTIDIDDSGRLYAVYENGARVVGYHIPLGTVASPDKLIPQNGNTYLPGSDSGDLLVGAANTGGLGGIVASALEGSGLQAVLKCLLAERVSIANLQLILEAVAEIAPHVRRAEQIAEHVRARLANQICADIAVDGVLSVLRLGPRWEATFHQATRRGEFGEVIEFDIDPSVLEQFTKQSSTVIRQHMDQGVEFALVVSPEARPYVRMIVERAFATLAVLSHLELARGVNIKTIGTID